MGLFNGPVEVSTATFEGARAECCVWDDSGRATNLIFITEFQRANLEYKLVKLIYSLLFGQKCFWGC